MNKHNLELNRRSFLSGAMLVAGLATRVFAATDGGSTPVVNTRRGKLRGRIIDGVHTFKGIPYGAPTGGANRFMPPQPPEPWTGIRDAFEYAHHAPQSNRARGVKQLEYFGILHPASTLGPSEDCLYLNVWTKGVNDGPTRPVIACIH